MLSNKIKSGKLELFIEMNKESFTELSSTANVMVTGGTGSNTDDSTKLGEIEV